MTREAEKVITVRSSTKPKLMNRAPNEPIRAAIVGTGYISDFHAYALRHIPGVELVSVCDVNLNSAQAFASRWGIAKVGDDLQSMLKGQELDAIHVLTPPDHHYSLTKTALQLGVNVLLEKPMCASISEADELLKLAQETGLHLGVSHNFLFSDAYQGLRKAVRSGLLGPLENVTLNYFFELGQIRSGPFESWMLRSPGNALLEAGPHLLSALLDLVGQPDELDVVADQEIALPGGSLTYRRWRIRSRVGSAAVDINLDLRPGFSQRSINVRGVLGTATADLDANTCAVDRAGALSMDFDRYRRSRAIARQLRSQARSTLTDYLLSKVGLRNKASPYQATILESVATYYKALRTGTPLDKRIDAQCGRDVIKHCSAIIAAARVDAKPAPKAQSQRSSATPPTVLVFGGTGFIGRELIRQLLEAGYSVRAAVRGSGAVLGEYDNSNLEIARINIESEQDLTDAMKGIEFVYHLARASAKTWDSYLRHDVEPTRLIAKACMAAHVKRLVYTGTIDSYYAGAKAGTITDDTPLDRNIGRRNYYARAKAAAETMLMEMHRSEGLPVVIYRPGIVLGQHGTPFHWGVGTWPAMGVCQVWGEGTCKLPLVLVADVAAALVRGIQVPGIDGRIYNLVDAPLLTARDYLTELQRIADLKLDVRYRSIMAFYLTDLAKWILKVALRHPDRHRIPSYLDWESRTQKAHFDCTRALKDLAWQPASDRQRMIDEGIRASLEGWLPDRP